MKPRRGRGVCVAWRKDGCENLVEMPAQTGKARTQFSARGDVALEFGRMVPHPLERGEFVECILEQSRLCGNNDEDVGAIA